MYVVLNVCRFQVLMSFLSSNLREEGSFEHKSEIVDALIQLSQSIPAAQEGGLLHLCEFIEDCEYSSLCTQILSFLGEQAPKTANPSKYIRFIYNRLILENAQIRAGGVDALAKIAVECKALRKDILMLLDCCLTDNDDEVRDRTTIYCRSFATSINPTVDLLDDDTVGYKHVDNDEDQYSCVSTAPSLEELFDTDLPVSLDALCDTLQKCADQNFDEASVNQIDVFKLPSDAEYRKDRPRALSITKETIKAPLGVPPKEQAPPATFKGVLAAASQELSTKVADIIPPETIGSLLHSGASSPLTEKEAEYTVFMTRHFFVNHVILEFSVSNTMPDQTLENVTIKLTSNDAQTGSAWIVVGHLPIGSLPFSVPGSTFIVLAKNTNQPELLQGAPELGVLVGSFGGNLSFLVKEEGDDIGYEDEYSLEAIEISIGDYSTPRVLRSGEFSTIWDTLDTPNGHECSAKLSLNFKTLEAAVTGLIQSLNLAACDRTDTLNDSSKVNHQLLLSGTFTGGFQVLCRSMIVMNREHGCLLKIVVRSKSEAVSSAVLRSFD